MKIYRQEKGSCRGKSEEVKGVGPRFEMEEGLLTRPDNCIKEESLRGGRSRGSFPASLFSTVGD